MIVRDALRLSFDLDGFDWFNDGKDTYRWLSAYCEHRAVVRFVAAAEKAGWKEWVIS